MDINRQWQIQIFLKGGGGGGLIFFQNKRGLDKNLGIQDIAV